MTISIEIARRVMDACKQRAQELRSPVSIAIVDSGGHLVLFERMMAPYGWATGNISIAKASTAVMFNQSTDAVAQWGTGIPGFASSMASMTQGRFIMAAGGWPIRMGGATVGGIGVSGGNAPGRDDDIARAGLAVLESAAPHSMYRPQGQPSVPSQPRSPLQPTPAYPAMSSPQAQSQQSQQAQEAGNSSPSPVQSSIYLGEDQEQQPGDEQSPFDDYRESRGGQQ